MNFAETTNDLAGGRLTIDLDALGANWRLLASKAPAAVCAGVVKGDGYGIGLERAAETLQAAGCTTFFVALPDEGLRARAVAPQATIYLLGGLFEENGPALAAAGIRPVLGSMEEIGEWEAFCRASGNAVPCGIHVDTGMNRLGLTLNEARALAGDPARVEAMGARLLISHLACADAPGHDLTAQQIARFSEIRALFPGLKASLANSAGVLGQPGAHFDLLRPGIALYGGEAISGIDNPMRPVVTLEARIIQIRNGNPGETVGYGATETLKRPSRIAVVAIGYADGYHRRAGSTDAAPGARVHLGGFDAPLVGRVSMDLIAIDVTGIPETVAHRGAWVEMFGPNVPVDEVADRAETIGYELLTGLGRRYRRTYLGGGA
ncbi:alanine racemase [Rhodobium orientis]|uniref:Alanine racemase n=1 Tax=Rhodobium orientis TaxID=34017 RepID=A0A327JTV9_9HYPH|nr:alanine racemase [Rhodobium orientis]MBB4302226.1 alanine racemase [Rhodobium orientis]MBK5948937.1 alanine racemase [Rhodobium orientis]RAI28936.1 alanine racemase [Rhodobium orientis]